ncbi:MAG: hypothetical protein Q9194_001763 [Teloschistes cf. exilis]
MEPPTRPAGAPDNSRWVSPNHWFTEEEMLLFFLCLQYTRSADAAMVQKVLWLKHRFPRLENLTIYHVKAIQHEVTKLSKPPKRDHVQPPDMQDWFESYCHNMTVQHIIDASGNIWETAEAATENNKLIESMDITGQQYLVVIVAQKYTEEFRDGLRYQMPSWIYSYAEELAARVHDQSENINENTLKAWTEWSLQLLHRASKELNEQVELVLEIPLRHTPLTISGKKSNWPDKKV